MNRIFVSQVNEGIREQENSERLEWLQRHVQINGLDERLVFNSLTNMVGPRKLVHFGLLRKVCQFQQTTSVGKSKYW